MTGVLFVIAIVAAALAMSWRRRRRRRLQSAALERAGATFDKAIYIRTFTEMDEHVQRRWCSCGGFLELSGEGSREHDGRRYRVARMLCHECDEESEVFFDTTDLLQ